MNSHMYNERCDSRKGFPALITLIGLFTCVNIVMFDEVLFLPENRATFITLIGLLSDMNFLMLSQIRFAAEGFSTLLTRIRFLSGVTSLVSDEA